MKKLLLLLILLWGEALWAIDSSRFEYTGGVPNSPDLSECVNRTDVTALFVLYTKYYEYYIPASQHLTAEQKVRCMMGLSIEELEVALLRQYALALFYWTDEYIASAQRNP